MPAEHTHRIPPGVPETPARRYIRRAWPLLPEREVRNAFARRDVKRNGARIAPQMPCAAATN